MDEVLKTHYVQAAACKYQLCLKDDSILHADQTVLAILFHE